MKMTSKKKKKKVRKFKWFLNLLLFALVHSVSIYVFLQHKWKRMRCQAISWFCVTWITKDDRQGSGGRGKKWTLLNRIKGNEYSANFLRNRCQGKFVQRSGSMKVVLFDLKSIFYFARITGKMENFHAKIFNFYLEKDIIVKERPGCILNWIYSGPLMHNKWV